MRSLIGLKSVFLVMLLMVFISGCSKGLQKESLLDTPENHYQQGLRRLEVGDLASAESEFMRARGLNKKYPGSYVGMGLLHMMGGDYKKAIDEVKTAIKRDKKFVDAYVAMGRIITAERKGDKWLGRAMDSYEKALEVAPENEMVYFYMGEAYTAAYQFNNAGRAYSMVIEQKGDYAGRANRMYEKVQKIQRAAPGTQLGKQIALIDSIDRSDLAVLLLEELKLKEVLQKRRPRYFDTRFKAYGSSSTAEKPTVNDISNHWAKSWIEDILALEITGLELFPGGQFRPEGIIVRANFAMVLQGILVLISNDQTLATRFIGETSHFPDVRSDYFAYNAISLAVDRGFISADKITGAFGVDKPVSGADALLSIRELQNALSLSF